MLYPLTMMFRACLKCFDCRFLLPVDSCNRFDCPLEYGFFYALEDVEVSWERSPRVEYFYLVVKPAMLRRDLWSKINYLVALFES